MPTLSVYAVVLGDHDEDRLKAYLYAHTELVGSCTVGRYTVWMLKTTAEIGTTDEAIDSAFERCQYLNRYQVERLESGLYANKGYCLNQEGVSYTVQRFVSEELAIQHRVVVQ